MAVWRARFRALHSMETFSHKNSIVDLTGRSRTFWPGAARRQKSAHSILFSAGFSSEESSR
jgi:hypothetical protein